MRIADVGVPLQIWNELREWIRLMFVDIWNEHAINLHQSRRELRAEQNALIADVYIYTVAEVYAGLTDSPPATIYVDNV